MDALDAAVAALRAGNPVVLPTDTVYGLCADPHSEDACRRALALKGRSASQPVAVIVASVEILLGYLPDAFHDVVGALLPGPFTLVLPDAQPRFPWLSTGTIGVRVPQLSGDATAVLAEMRIVMATSANRHGGKDPRTLAEVPAEILDGCGAVVDGGELPGVPSTVVDLTGPEPRVLREGAVPAADTLARIAAVRGA
jgi:tRNA threonylcarbamoyl adenosine modification protein (Sua5/YciO/YrdC/YwlC family)